MDGCAAAAESEGIGEVINMTQAEQKEDRQRKYDLIVAFYLTPHTLKETAEEFGLTGERVRQILVMCGQERQPQGRPRGKEEDKPQRNYSPHFLAVRTRENAALAQSGMRRCGRCLEIKEVADFTRFNKQGRLSPWCKSCKAKWARERKKGCE